MKPDGFQSDTHLEKLERAGRTITSVQSCSGKSQESYGDQRKEHEMKSETKAMICTAAVLIAMGIYKELAALCLITAMIYEEGVKKFDK